MLRDRADAAVAAGRTPQMLLVALGPVSAYTARATFAKNLYEAGGIRTEVIEFNPLSDDSARLFAAATGDGASAAVCLCSSDAVYGESAEAAAQALTNSGVMRIHLAGKPGALGDALAAAGVTVYIHAGVNVLEVLRSTLDDLGAGE